MKATMKPTMVILNAKGSYYLGTFFTSLVVIILSFGFAKIIELLYEVQERLDTLTLSKN